MKYRGIFINDEAPALGRLDAGKVRRAQSQVLRPRVRADPAAQRQLSLARDVGPRDLRRRPREPQAGRRVRHRHRHLAPRADDAGPRRVGALRQRARGTTTPTRPSSASSGPRASAAWAERERRHGRHARRRRRADDRRRPTSRSWSGSSPTSGRSSARSPARTRPTVPQMWALYKEVQDYYDKGMRVPDDVTLLLCDDNWGNIRKLPKRGEAAAGRRLRHLLPLRLRRRAAELQVAQHQLRSPASGSRCTWPIEHGVDRLWIVNVGDIKPMEFPTEFFLDYAWNPEAWPAERLAEYTRLWAAEQFGDEHAAAIADILAKYTQIQRPPQAGAARRPTPTASSTTARRRRSSPTTTGCSTKRSGSTTRCRAEYRDAYFQLVLHPVKACANLERAVRDGRPRTGSMRSRAGRRRTTWPNTRRGTVRQGRRIIALLQQGAGRRQVEPHDGSDAHRLHLLAGTAEEHAAESKKSSCPPTRQMGVAVEGSESWWPESTTSEAVLPELSPSDNAVVATSKSSTAARHRSTMRSKRPQPWLHGHARSREQRSTGKLERSSGCGSPSIGQRAPAGVNRAPITITGPDDKQVVVRPSSTSQPSPAADDSRGFVESEWLCVDGGRALRERRRRRTDPLAAHSRLGPHALRHDARSRHRREPNARRRQSAARISTCICIQDGTVKVQAYRLADAQFSQHRRLAVRRLVRRPAAADRQYPRRARICKSGKSGSPTTST